LKQLPIDWLKIDRSFVQDIGDSAIISAVLSLGAAMGLKVVAEGVEEASQLDLLAALGCDQVQGFYFARPMPADGVADFLIGFSGHPASHHRLRPDRLAV
jgi:EAL domain-containing protein (putative c-di-GMP-specific phosphodiesterase class I)